MIMLVLIPVVFCLKISKENLRVKENKNSVENIHGKVIHTYQPFLSRYSYVGILPKAFARLHMVLMINYFVVLDKECDRIK